MWPHGLQYARLACPLHLLEFAETHVYWVGDGIQTSHPLYPLLLLPSIFPNIRVFSNESDLCIRWPTYWSFSFSITHSNEYSGLISFKTEWFDLLAIQRTLKSLLQHYSSKASILHCSVVKNYDFITHNNFPTCIIKKSVLSIVWYIWICIHIYHIYSLIYIIHLCKYIYIYIFTFL